VNLLSKIFSSDYLIANPSIVAAMLAGLVATIVALLTFFGVLLSNRSSTNRAKADRQHSALQSTAEREAMQERVAREHQHTADEAHRERLTTTRRQVYLEAMEAWAAAQVKLISLAGTDISDLTKSDFLEKLSASTAKIRVVADQDTALAAQELLKLFSQTFINGLSILMQQGGPQGALVAHERDYEKTQNSIHALLESMKFFNLNGNTNQAEFDRLQRAFDAERKAADTISFEADIARAELLEIGNQFRQQQLEWSISVSHKVVDFTCALRRELGIATDARALHEQTERMNREALTAYDTLMTRVQAAAEQ